MGKVIYLKEQRDRRKPRPKAEFCEIIETVLEPIHEDYVYAIDLKVELLRAADKLRMFAGRWMSLDDARDRLKTAVDERLPPSEMKRIIEAGLYRAPSPKRPKKTATR